MNRPYKRGDVARALITLVKDFEADKFRLNSLEKKIVIKLVREFKNEMETLQNKEAGTEFPRLGIHVAENIDSLSGPHTKLKGIYRSRLAIPLGKYGAIYNGMSFNQYMVDDPNYVGKKWRGLVEFTEQSYIALGTGKIGLKFGRDFLRWGAGRSGTLLFSDAARPMDQIGLNIHYGPFHYSFVAGTLDPMNYHAETLDTLEINSIRRYVSAHRLDARFFNNKIQCAITEVILYGGKHRTLDWRYLNPFLSYHAESNNDADQANTMGSLDLTIWPEDGTELYGSLLIDDIQVEKTGPGDLEPDEIGWLVGGRISDPILTIGTSIFTEYVKVANRTYKTLKFWETFQHRNVPLGYPLGNDFDRFELGCSQWFNESIWAKISWAGIRRGEGGIFTPFDTPWMQYTVEEGYHEPFPSGVIEKGNEVNVSVRYNQNRNMGFEAEFRSTKTKNAGHVSGKSASDVFWRVGLWFSGDLAIRVNP